MSQLIDAQLNKTKISKGWQLRNGNKRSRVNLWKRRKTEIIIQSQSNVKGDSFFSRDKSKARMAVFEIVLTTISANTLIMVLFSKQLKLHQCLVRLGLI